MSEKIPVVKRLALHLERHGLSFGDALNIALFGLTIASLVLAYEAVRIAKETLRDARIQAAKAAQDQDAQFQAQMAQLRTSSHAMLETSGLLKSQSDILRDLQSVSRQQLKDLNSAEARIERQERARPAPRIDATCNREPLVSATEELFKSSPARRILNEARVRRLADGTLNCYVSLTNEGDGDLINTSLEIQVGRCLAPGPPELGNPSADVSIKRLHDLVLPPGRRLVSLVSGENVPPASRAKKSLGGTLIVAPGDKCPIFDFLIVLKANNLDESETVTTVMLSQLSDLEIRRP